MFLKYLREKHDWKTIFFYSSWSLTLTAGLSYGLGLLRDHTLANLFGLSRELDIYNAAFVLPEGLFNILMGTVLSAAFLPIFAKQYDHTKEEGVRYARQILSWGMAAILACSILLFVTLPSLTPWLVPGFEPAATEKYILITRLLLLSPMLFTLSNTYGRILMSFREFFWYGLSPALYNLGIVFGAIFLAPTWGITGLVAGTLFGNVLHLLNRWVSLRRHRFDLSPRLAFTFSPEVKETLWLTAPKLVQYGVAALMLAIFTQIASGFDAGSVAAYNYARNFQSLPVSLLGIAIASALFPSLAHDAAKGNFKKFREDFKKGRMRTLVYTTLAGILLAAISQPLIRLLLGGGKFGGDDVRLLALVLQVYCLSVPLESLEHTYHRAYYALRNTLIPSTVHTIFMLASIVAAGILAPRIGVLAIPVSFAGGLAGHILILAMWFPRVFKKAKIQSSISTFTPSGGNGSSSASTSSATTS